MGASKEGTLQPSLEKAKTPKSDKPGNAATIPSQDEKTKTKASQEPVRTVTDPAQAPVSGNKQVVVTGVLRTKNKVSEKQQTASKDALIGEERLLLEKELVQLKDKTAKGSGSSKPLTAKTDALRSKAKTKLTEACKDGKLKSSV